MIALRRVSDLAQARCRRELSIPAENSVTTRGSVTREAVVWVGAVGDDCRQNCDVTVCLSSSFRFPPLSKNSAVSHSNNSGCVVRAPPRLR